MSDKLATSGHDQVVSAVRPLVADRAPPLLVAVDGRSGAGKSTLARSVAEEIGAAIVLADDFYAGGTDEAWLSVSPRDRADRVIDWQRLRSEALEPLLSGREATWHPLDFEPGVGWVGWKQETVSVRPSDVVLLDGAYSSRPELQDLIDFAVLVEPAERIRRSRLLAREGENFIGRWHALWDSAEEFYFGAVRPSHSFDLVVSGN